MYLCVCVCVCEAKREREREREREKKGIEREVENKPKMKWTRKKFQLHCPVPSWTPMLPSDNHLRQSSRIPPKLLWMPENPYESPPLLIKESWRISRTLWKLHGKSQESFAITCNLSNIFGSSQSFFSGKNPNREHQGKCSRVRRR